MQKVTPVLVLSCEFCEIFKSTYLVEHLQTAEAIRLTEALLFRTFPAGIYLFKISSVDTQEQCEICSK